MTERVRPDWAAPFSGEIIGEDWQLDSATGSDPPWAIIWNEANGEVVAVQVESTGKAGRFIPLATVPPGPSRWQPGVPELIRRIRDNAEGGIAYLAGVLHGQIEARVRAWLDDAIREKRGVQPALTSRRASASHGYLPMPCRCGRVRLLCQIDVGDRGHFVRFIQCEKCRTSWGIAPSGRRYDDEVPHPEDDHRDLL